jgi:N4-gp56 family major capsid protein
MPDITTRTQVTAENQSFYDKNLLFRATPQLVHTKFAQIRDIPRNAGTNTIKFRRYGNLAAAKTPLTEGITPAGKQLSITDVTATVAQYGDYVTITDVLDYESVDPILMETGEILGDQYADTIDQLTCDILNAGSVLARAAARASRITIAAGDVITATLIDTGILTLKNNNCRMITSMVDASTGVATQPIGKAYVAINHTNLSPAIKALTGFVKVENYANKADVMEGEYGYYNNTRFIESTNGKIFTGLGAAGIDVYSLIIMGQHAYGTTRVSGEAIKNIIKPLGSAGTADALDQRATSGWKATFVAKILNDAFIYRIECALV